MFELLLFKNSNVERYIMKMIKRYACLVEVLSVILIPIMIMSNLLCWTWDKFGNVLVVSLGYSFDLVRVRDSVVNLPSIVWHHRFIGIVIQGIATVLIVLILINIIRLMRLLKIGEFFSLATVNLLSTISKVAFVLIVYIPVKNSLLHLIETLHKGPGYREIVLSFGTTDLINVMLFCLGLILLLLLQEAYKLKTETDLTV